MKPRLTSAKDYLPRTPASVRAASRILLGPVLDYSVDQSGHIVSGLKYS